MTQVRLQPEAKGLSFVRLAIAMAASRKDADPQAAIIAEKRWGERSLAHQVLAKGGIEFVRDRIKANVPAGATASGNWAELLGNYEAAAAEFFSFVRERSLLGRIPGLRRVPLHTRLVGAATGFSAAWTGEGQAKPVGRATFAEETLPTRKVSSLSIVTQELLESMDPAAELMIRNDMASAMVAVIDETFINPANSGTANVEPPSIANGAPADAATGTSTDDIRDAVAFSIGQFDGDLTRAVIIGRPEFFAHVGLQSAFMAEQLGARGGSLGGIPAIPSTALPLDAGGKQQLVLLDPDAIALGEEGMDLRTARQASIEMVDEPTGSATAPTGASTVSLWQTNSVGILAEKRVNFQLARAGGVRVITGLVGGAAS
jgi:hypothetical protein